MSQINKPSDYFNTVLYTGTGSNLAITGVGFKPDWVWCKSRSAAENHTSWDAVRGSTARLSQDTTGAEYVNATQGIQSFDNDGFTCGVSSQYNASGQTQVSWCWLGGGTASSNTDGSITSQVSASTTSGFSIVSYTGTGAVGNIGHGLGSTPKMIIKKRRNGADAWNVWHESLGDGSKALFLNTTNATDTNANYASNVPTSSLFYVGTDSQINASGGTYIAYCFAEKKGFSKFGSYTGNGNADGTFVYTGFKPAMIITKANAVADWFIRDNKQDPENVMNEYLSPNTTATSGNLDSFDFVSNGFKIRNSNNAWNGSGTTYFYMAFAEQPLVGSNNVCATAR